MFLIDLMGAALTLIAVGFLALGGYLGALRLLREEAVRDPLALAIASLLLATAEAVGIGLLLGGLGLLRIDLALALQAALSLVLLMGYRKSPPIFDGGGGVMSAGASGCASQAETAEVSASLSRIAMRFMQSGSGARRSPVRQRVS